MFGGIGISYKDLVPGLHTFDFKCFVERIFVLTLLPNIRMYSKFYLILIQTSSEMMTALSVYFVGNRFCK